MNKQEVQARINRLRRLVQQAESRETEAAGRLSVCFRAVDQADAKLKSLLDYRAPDSADGAPLSSALLNNDRRFAASVARAQQAQAGVVDQYRSRAIAAETDWFRCRKKLDVLARALAAIQSLQRQELARAEQLVADDLVSQSGLGRPSG